uniref:Spermine synthase n=1 Tax=Acrobeloides nanus TaxID=290746 RepID=A0A914C575_9BILA
MENKILDNKNIIEVEIEPCPISFIEIGPLPDVGLDVEVTYSFNTIFAGTSEINGKYVIVDVEENNRLYRRLMFNSDNTFIQSECILSGDIGTDYLVPYHRVMIDSLRHIYGGITRVLSTEMSFCVLGLGGGLLTKFLYDKFPKSKVTTVEIDPEMVPIAQKFFNLPEENERLRLVVDDAIVFLKNSAGIEKFDAIFCDVAGDNSTEKLVFSPPSGFITKEVLRTMRDCLNDRGLLLMNFVARDFQTKSQVKNDIAEIFPKVLSGSYKKDISEIVICPLHRPTKTEQMIARRWKVDKSKIVKNRGRKPKDIGLKTNKS